jgi:hypothetical protein
LSLSVGIVGLPSAGKSTLFNALTRAHAAVAAFPFTTIEPNTGVVAVPDDRIPQLADLFHPPRVIPATVTFTDIAGLVRGAHSGEGLGTQFLGHIRSHDAIAFVLRAFTASEILELELTLADIATVDRRLERVGKVARAGGAARGVQAEVRGLSRVREALDRGEPARRVTLGEEEMAGVRDSQLLTAKPVIYVANVDEGEAGAIPLAAQIAERAAAEGADFVEVSAKLEAELAELAQPGRIPLPLPADLLHRGRERGSCLDRAGGRQRQGRCGGDPHRLRQGVHPGRGLWLAGTGRGGRLRGSAGPRPTPARGARLLGPGRRCDALPVQRLNAWGRPPGPAPISC